VSFEEESFRNFVTLIYINYASETTTDRSFSLY